MIQRSELDKIRLRPRFRIKTQYSPEEYKAILQKLLSENKDHFFGNPNTEQTIIGVNSEQTNYYKPFLALRCTKENDGYVLQGIFGPSASVWTFFMFLYFGFSILWMVFITIWFVGRQLKLPQYEWALGASLGILFLIFLVYIATKIGQKKAKEEMNLLREFAIKSVS